MKSKQYGNKILLELSSDESLVLFEFLARFNEEDSNLFEDDAERRVLWDIECCLERIIPEIFNDNYESLVSKARENVRD